MEKSKVEADLEYKGRQSNKDLGNFRLLGKSRHQQYFTPLSVAKVILEVMKAPFVKAEYKLNDVSVLDPTCGSGRLLLPWHKAGARVLGIELDSEVSKVAGRLLSKQNIRNGDLLEYAAYLSDFTLAVCNPPYGIFWDVSDSGYSFESECYGGSIESQTATLEVITQALGYNGLVALIVPTSSFTNEKDKGFRNHLYENYRILLRATCAGMFKQAYGINVLVDLVFLQRYYSYDDEPDDYPHIELDIFNDKKWQAKLLEKALPIFQNEDLASYPQPAKYVPRINTLRTIPLDNRVTLKPKGISAPASSLALLDLLDNTVKAHNPIRGIETGLIEAYFSPPALLRNDTGELSGVLTALGFECEISKATTEKLSLLKKRYDLLMTPLYPPKSHQLLAYFEEKEYPAKATVKDNEGKPLFKKDKRYFFKPCWVRKRETVSVENVYDERKKKNSTVTTAVDRGYLSIEIETETDKRVFAEINTEAIELLLKAFDLPEIKDVSVRFSELVERNRKRVEREFPFLFDYQQEDLARLALKPLGYLGYEMGGGKTVAAASWAKFRGYKRALIVCQSSLVENWMNELKKFGFEAKKLTTHSSIDILQKEKRQKQKPDTTTFYVTSYEFLSLDTQRIYDPWECLDFDKDGNVKHHAKGITSGKCPTCNRRFENVVKTCPKCGDKDFWSGYCCSSCGYVAYSYKPKTSMYPAYKRIKKLFAAVIVDEAQMAKTKNSARGRAVRALKAKGKLILTGTLMRGYITDVFWNLGWLLGFLTPLFPYAYKGGSKQFLEEFGTNEFVTKQFEDTLSEGRAKLIPEVSNLNRFWRLLGPFMIRRLKDQMIELKEKHRQIMILPMDDEHRQLYGEYEQWATDTIRKAMNNGEGLEKVNMGIISRTLWKLRFAATVPTASDYLKDKNGPGVYLVRYNKGWNKLNKLYELVAKIKEKQEKVIIFSGLRPMVAAISELLRLRDIGIMPILASHKASKRFDMLERFKESSGITAIVTGLNVLNRGFTITSANHVIFTDIDYTPESILQAEDRVHRTGQNKDVFIYYLFSQGTIDEVMFNLVIQKSEAIAQAIDGKARDKNVAEILSRASGSIQLEIAKQLLSDDRRLSLDSSFVCEQASELPEPEPIVIETATALDSSKGLSMADLYEQLNQLKTSRKKKQNHNQLALFSSVK